MPDVDTFLQQASSVEDAFSVKIAKWREDHAGTNDLRQEILLAMRDKTFNSLAMLRWYSEILLFENEIDEALAAFDTYAVLQAQHVLKHYSGARASPEHIEVVVAYFSLVLTALEDASRISFGRITKLGELLNSIVVEFSQEVKETSQFKAAVATIGSRISLLKALNSKDEDTYQQNIANAGDHFNNLAPSNDARAECARGLFLALTSDPATAFAPVKLALTLNPADTQGAILLVQLLSAADQHAEALKLVRVYTAELPYNGTLAEKARYVQLKKTEIALVEVCKGPEMAFEELAEFIANISGLFLPEMDSIQHRPRVHSSYVASRPSFMRKINPMRRVNTSPSKPTRIFSFRSKPIAESIASSTSTPTRGPSAVQLAEKESKIMASSWFWIAQQYIRAQLVAEARSAIDEALQFLGDDEDMMGTAYKHALLGLIEHSTTPDRALKHYKLALNANPLHITAAIGAVAVVANAETVDLDFARYLQISLETISVTNPGRFIPEVWCARAKVCELIGGLDSAREMYWKTIALEERRAITSYVYSNSNILA